MSFATDMMNMLQYFCLGLLLFVAESTAVNDNGKFERMYNLS